MVADGWQGKEMDEVGRGGLDMALKGVECGKTQKMLFFFFFFILGIKRDSELPSSCVFFFKFSSISPRVFPFLSLSLSFSRLASDLMELNAKQSDENTMEHDFFLRCSLTHTAK